MARFVTMQPDVPQGIVTAYSYFHGKETLHMDLRYMGYMYLSHLAWNSLVHSE